MRPVLLAKNFKWDNMDLEQWSKNIPTTSSLLLCTNLRTVTAQVCLETHVKVTTALCVILGMSPWGWPSCMWSMHVVDYCTSSDGRIVTLDLKVELYNMFNVKWKHTRAENTVYSSGIPIYPMMYIHQIRMGVCQGTGVRIRDEGGIKIAPNKCLDDCDWSAPWLSSVLYWTLRTWDPKTKKKKRQGIRFGIRGWYFPFEPGP